MSYKLVQQFINEIFIDAKKRFAKKRANDFSKKIQHLVDDTPNIFERQSEQEKYINDRLDAVMLVPNKFVSQKRMRLAVPDAFGDNEFDQSASVFDIINLSDPQDYYYDSLKAFAKANAEQLLNAHEHMKFMLLEIETDADAMDWPAPWRRYTRWGSISSNVNYFASKLKKILS